ncbi:MAG: Gfo/Idh/MocA family oxidoreductase [Ruthenibacterium lactatiformans]
MLDREALDAVFIGTRCGLHARYAALVMERGLPLFLKSPYASMKRSTPGCWPRRLRSEAAYGLFPAHVTCIVQEMKRLVDSGALGDVVSVQAVNNVPYGGVYYHSWYRDAALTGGLFSAKSTHDIDYITHILGKRPVSVAALTSKCISRQQACGLRARTALNTAPARKAALLWNTAARKSPLASCAACQGHRKRKMWARRCSPAKTARSFHTIRHFL